MAIIKEQLMNETQINNYDTFLPLENDVSIPLKDEVFKNEIAVNQPKNEVQKTKFNFFNKISGLFSNNLQKREIKKRFDESSKMIQAELSDKFDASIKSNLYDFCAELEAKGYVPNKKQKQILDEKVLFLIKKNGSNYKRFKDIYGDFSLEIKKEVFFNNEFYDQVLAESIFEKELKDQGFVDILMDFVKDDLKQIWRKTLKELDYSYESIGCIRSGTNSEIFVKLHNNLNRKLKFILKNKENLEFKEVNEIFDLFVDLEEQIKKTLNKFKEKANGSDYEDTNKKCVGIENFNSFKSQLKGVIKEKIEEDKNNLFKKAQSIKKIDKEIEVGFKKEMDCRTTGFKNLPGKVKEVVDELMVKHSSVLGFNLDKNEYSELEVIMANVPKIITKYLSIDDEYKTTLRNSEGKTALDLMLESLNKIDSILNEKIKNKNELAIKDLSVFNRKIKNY